MMAFNALVKCGTNVLHQDANRKPGFSLPRHWSSTVSEICFGADESYSTNLKEPKKLIKKPKKLIAFSLDA
jgi:hypothetical protein